MAFERLTRWWRSLGAGAAARSSLDDGIVLPCHASYIHWDFAAPAATIEWDLTIEHDPGTGVGEYLALYNGTIDGSAFYFGLQTDVADPGRGRGIGKGLIFSTWWSFDEADVRIADDGFRELGTHEGRFVGVRRPYAWATGEYRVALARAGSDDVGGRTLDWFDLHITPLTPSDPAHAAARHERCEPSGPTTWIGAMRFPRRSPARPATIAPGGVSFLEVYAGARTFADVPRWSAAVMAYADGVACPSGRTEYARYPHDQLMPNADLRYDPVGGRVHLAMGAGVDQIGVAGAWP